MALRISISHKYRGQIGDFHIVEVIATSILDGVSRDAESSFVVTDGEDFSQNFEDFNSAVHRCRFAVDDLVFTHSPMFAQMFAELLKDDKFSISDEFNEYDDDGEHICFANFNFKR